MTACFRVNRMKDKKGAAVREFIFYSPLAPETFIENLKCAAARAHMTCIVVGEQVELTVGSNHYGREIFKARVEPTEEGHSFIRGVIEAVPYFESRKESALKKFFSAVEFALFLIIMSPVILVCVIGWGIYAGIMALLGKKVDDHVSAEEVLDDLMVNKLRCTRGENYCGN